MLDKKIVASNKMLCIFDDMPEADYEFIIITAKMLVQNEGYNDPEYIDTNYQLYHNSWEWLIPLAKKIKKVITEDYITYNEFNSAIITLDRDTIYSACVEFVIEYNKNISIISG